MQWSIRNLLNPVITRCLIYGVNPIDLEYVLKKVEEKPLVNSKVLEKTWITEWENKASRFLKYAKIAEEDNNHNSCGAYYELASKCYYACYLINSDDIESKKQIYKKLETSYLKMISFKNFSFNVLSIPMKNGKTLPCYLHLPEQSIKKEKYPCVIVCPGIGSCKEELETLARPLVERGIAVIAPDMPGTGNALFEQNIKLQAGELELGFEKIMDTIKTHSLLDETKIGTYGLCMGGGYACRIAKKFSNQVNCCVNLFPLYVHNLGENSIPRWMKQGAWADFQMGTIPQTVFMKQMEILSEGNLKSKYLLVHSKYDNWAEEDVTMQIYNSVSNEKEELSITEAPAFSSDEEVMHKMPVGEQMHWLKHYGADWIVKHIE